MSSLVDTKTLGKLDTFDGTTDHWEDWVFRASAWLLLLPTEGVDMENCLKFAKGSDAELGRHRYPADVDRLGVVIYNALIQAIRGRALSVAKSVEHGNGRVEALA